MSSNNETNDFNQITRSKMQSDIKDLETAKNLVEHVINLKKIKAEQPVSTYNDKTVNDMLKVARQILLGCYQH